MLLNEFTKGHRKVEELTKEFQAAFRLTMSLVGNWHSRPNASASATVTLERSGTSAIAEIFQTGENC